MGAIDQYRSTLEGWGGGTGDQLVDRYLSMFNQSYRNLTGQDPGKDIQEQFISQAVQPLAHPDQLGYSDQSALVNNFIQNTYGPQIAGHQQQLQTDQLGSTQKMIQDLIQKQTQATASDLGNPNSPTYQGFAGRMNDMGITPSSGAFQAGLGGVLGQSAAGAENAALGSVGLPTIGGIQGINQIPFNFAQGNSNLGHINSMQDFGMQGDLARMMQEMMQPSGAQQNLGMASAASNAAKNFFSLGGGSGNTGTSYVCMELIKRGLLCETDMDDFHVHIMPAMFKKGRAFWKYAMDGKRLVDAVNARGLSWEHFKPLLFDRVMEEKDPCKAVDLYADACCQLCWASDYSLWDKRVYRTSYLDSLPFLPRLLCYRPFIEALWKCVRIKTLIVYDKPRCGVHYGA